MSAAGRLASGLQSVERRGPFGTWVTVAVCGVQRSRPMRCATDEARKRPAAKERHRAQTGRQTCGPEKTCAFLCGSVCRVAADPIDGKRRGIRWAYDTIGSTSSSGKGANCHYCERAWSEAAVNTEHHDRLEFQALLGRGAKELQAFLELRKRVVERATTRCEKSSRRRGGLCPLMVNPRI